MPVADAPDLRSTGALHTTGEVEIDAFSNVARLVPSPTTITLIASQVVVAPGADGRDGTDGEPGPPGPSVPGSPGPTGTTGPQGFQGIPGADGVDGIDGQDGPAGLQGVQGPTGAQGVPGPMGPPGSEGDEGPAGEPGPQGPAGVQGPIGATGPSGANGVQGPPGGDGEDGIDGNDGAPGSPGAQGPTGPTGPTGPAGANGSQGPPGTDGSDGSDGNQGPPGNDGAAGATGATGATGAAGPMGFMGPPGTDGSDGVDGFPGPPGANGTPGATGATGATGPAGVPGVPGVDGSDTPNTELFMMPMTTNVNNIVAGSPEGGITLSATTHALEIVTTVAGDIDYEASFQDATSSGITPGSSQGNITTATTTTAVSAPGGSTGRTIVEMNILNSDVANQTLTVQKDVSGTNHPLWGPAQLGPLERLEFTAAMGWRVFQQNGAEKAGGGGTSTLMSPGEQLGLQIDAGANALPVRLSGAEQGENIRFATMQDDTTLTGDQGATSYPINEPVNMVNITAPSFVIIHGVAFSGPGGSAAVAGTGRMVRVYCRGNSAPILWRHESGTEASDGRKIQCPGAIDYLQQPREAILLWQDPTINRRILLPTGYPSALLYTDEDFEPECPSPVFTANLTEYLFTQAYSQHWQAIANVSRGALSNLDVIDHVGTKRLTTGNVSSDTLAVFLDQTTQDNSAPGLGLTQSTLYGFDFWVRPTGTATRGYTVGVGVDVLNASGGADSIIIRYDSAVNANWLCATTASSSSTTTTTAVAVTTNNWYKLSARKYPNGGVLFLINDNPVGWHTTNVPTAVGAPFAQAFTASAAAVTLDIDRCRVFVTEAAKFT